MSLIKNKNNSELWGEVPRFRGKITAPRFRTRVGYGVTKRIDKTHALIITPKFMDVVSLIDKELTTEHEYYNSKMSAFQRTHMFGLPSHMNIVERCITFEGGRRIIPREHREYRITNKPIGK